MPGGAAPPAEDFFDPALPAPSAPTANTLSDRAVFTDPHDGHLTSGPSSSSAADIVRCNCSNFASHDLQIYS
jgi:hypothetical protein